MHKYTTDRISEFEAHAEEFKEVWKTILLRAAWFEAEGAPRLLLLSIRLKSDLPAKYPKPAITPQIDEYKIAWEARPISQLRKTLAELAAGGIQVEGVALKLEYKNNSVWQETGTPSVSFEWPGVFNPHERECAELSIISLDSSSTQIYEPVMDRAVESKWRGLPAPFWNRQDVLKNFFEITKGGDQNQIIVYAGGTIPIFFHHDTHVSVNKLHLGIALPAGASSKKVSIGLISSPSLGGPDQRRQVATGKAGWKKTGSGWQYKSEIDLEDQFRRVALLLRYGKTTVERLDLIPVGTPTSNAAVVAQAAIDPSEEFFTAGLFGRGEKPGDDFERTVAFLLSFCGLAVLPYGDIDRFNNSAPDIMAASSRDNVVLAVECTISSPNTNGKLNKLHQRCRSIEGRLKGQRLIPVLATPLMRAAIPASELSMALQDRIAVLAGEQLFELNAMATQGRPLVEIIRFIEKQRGPDPNALFGGI